MNIVRIIKLALKARRLFSELKSLTPELVDVFVKSYEAGLYLAEVNAERRFTTFEQSVAAYKVKMLGKEAADVILAMRTSADDTTPPGG